MSGDRRQGLVVCGRTLDGRITQRPSAPGFADEAPAYGCHGESNKAYKLKGAVQIDDAYLGGERRETPGRDAAGKIPFLAAVETHDGKPAFIKLRPVPAFTHKAVMCFAEEAIEPSSEVNYWIFPGLAVFLLALARGLALIGWHPYGTQKSPLLPTTWHRNRWAAYLRNRRAD